MQISKVATAVALSTGLLFGCNSDGLPIPTDSGAGSQESVLTTGYWQISDGNSSSISASSNADLPNVYVFQEDGNHKYYDDDDDLGTYTIKDASASTNNYDEEAGTVSFTYYETGTSTIEILDGVFSFDDAGALNISDNTTGIDYSGSDQTATDAVQEAISEANEANGINGYVQILDTNNGGVKNDVGELRLKLSDSSTGATVDSIASGKVTVDLIYQVDEDTEQEANGSGNNAYISLYASGTSNTNLHGEVIFNAGEIFYRSTVTDSSGKPQIPDEPVGTYTLGEDLAVEISWASGYYTFKVNDTVYDNSGNGFEAFDKAAVTIVSLKLGDTSNTTHYELNADNFKVYSNDTASDELVFEDNFNNYPNGQALSGNPYNNNTAEATVVVDGGNTEPEPPVDGDFPVALNEYTFDNADYTTDSGSADNDLTSKSGSPLITTTSGAAGTGAMHIDQDSATGGGYGYIYYNATSTTTTGAQAIEDSFSVETVIKADRFGYDSDVSLVDFAESSDYLGFKLYLESSDNSIKFKVYGGLDADDKGLSTEAKSSEGDVYLVEDNWYHILATYNHLDSTANLYIDGTLAHSKSVDFSVIENTTDDKFILLGGSSSSDKNFDGSVDNIAVWNTVLTDVQIQERVAQFTAE
ncbi:LamG domain-containing protein [Vibrio cyclitrophicus]